MQKRSYYALLTHPATIFLGVILGFTFGLYFPRAADYLGPIADSYLSLLILCILPIIISIVVLGLAGFLNAKEAHHKILKFFVMVVITVLSLAVFAVLAALVLWPGVELHTHAEYMLGKLLKAVAYYPVKHAVAGSGIPFADFLRSITPRNIVKALSEGLTIKLMIFAVLIGVALGKIPGKYSNSLRQFVASIEVLFSRIFHWLLYLLPLWLFCLFAGQAANMNFALLSALARFVVLFYVLGAVILLAFNFIIAVVVKRSFFAVLNDFKRVLMLAFFADSNFIPLPNALRVLRCYKLSAKVVDVTFPLGVSVIKLGRVILIAILMVFMVNFYAVPLGFAVILKMILLSAFLAPILPGRIVLMAPIFAGLAAAAGIPGALGALVLVVLDPFVNRLECALNVYGNCVVTALVAKGK
ncbi:MAG: cation:dicarboxylase symporter family transporter [Gammaproteobacteria bacterium]|nr:cation:dicarboxylase symporter family transporter [Gammaproteobacteria bacterium]